MDNQVKLFLDDNKEQLALMMKDIMPLLNKEMETDGIHGVVQYAYGFVDAANEKMDMGSKTTCSSGCNFCCYSDINMSSLEAQYTVDVVKHFSIEIDKTLIDRQNRRKFHRLKYADKRCVMLDDSGNCKIYDHRPLICRLWNSTSDPKLCNSKDGYQVTRTARILECWAMALALMQFDMANGIDSRKIYLHEILKDENR